MIPKNKKQYPDKYHFDLSEQLSEFFPEVEDCGGKYISQDNNDDQKINELPILELTEILSKMERYQNN